MSDKSLRSVNRAAKPGYVIPPHGRGALRPFQPGQSGNPAGKGGLYQEAQRICREATPAAARRMVELMNSKDERVALMAADKVYERAWGKSKVAPDDDIDPAVIERRQTLRAELMDFLQEMAKPEALNQAETPERGCAPSRREVRGTDTASDPISSAERTR
ncbi:hypothetical protein [Limobrevibacterium gyesilva]|uniref:DUF5681 domain-containing protein n=1 Tax=Limobrevibacterium gyesilva TaxID=2991712 RepID=A0AA41YSK9_9PROT|nr:hypothetical protein [Limobrevibacterium gyesilva]MCW3474702.1 hypothetical protein [Limobrevibacterium gyesilva]